MKKYLPSIIFGVCVLFAWEITVYMLNIPKYLFPSPFDVAHALVIHGNEMLIQLGTTMEVALIGFAIAIFLGLVLSFAMVQSKKLEHLLFPYVILTQVTPVIAIAPLVVLLIKDTFLSLIFCSVIIALFPIVSNTTIGLKSVSPGLLSLFSMYKANKIQILFRLRLMSSLPYLLGSLRVASGLSIVGAVVGGFVAGSTSQNSGIAYSILQDGYNLETSQLFACVILLGLAGLLLFFIMNSINWLFLHKWHDSVAGGSK